MQTYQDIDTQSTLLFVKELIRIADLKIQAIKTDNASIFTNRYLGYDSSSDPFHPQSHTLDMLCNEFGISLPH